MKEYEFQRDAEVCMGDYELSCDRLAELFCEKHDFYPLSGDSCFRSWWVGDHHGEVLAAGDYFFDMSTIVDDIRMNIPEEMLIRWYDYRTDGGEMNYRTWVKLQEKNNESKNQETK